ncbi:MAG: hypothetical protein EOO12_02895 [Chitinophagaceae bacterium]|uniref:Phosphoribosylpyrophosphate synthetase n=2 Tax=Flaviaesturariibacter aridisoli TaxID=2545761 RepID=A0A4R4E199_9BACT|nr:MAG: hypothetical protein EOO12_02895 [Chitinophagaceae bacterium]TCZ73176.1 hypothetical protein E0486_07290 [Flaviaesturariibacter aridisoli]
MTDMAPLLNKLTLDGYADQFRVEKGKLVSMDDKKSFKPKDIKAVNFYRFEGISDPEDMSIIYAIETHDGHKGTLTDAYGRYADEEVGKFMQEVEVKKQVN